MGRPNTLPPVLPAIRARLLACTVIPLHAAISCRQTTAQAAAALVARRAAEGKYDLPTRKGAA